MIIAGLTGSIGMGKSTTASLFAEQGIPIWDADAAVHRLYGRDGAAVGPVGDAFPGVVVDGAIDRERLGAIVLADPEAIRRLESIVHPLVAQDRQTFLDRQRAARSPVVILDIPLLFEGGGNKHMDAVIVVSAPPEVQRERVLARPGMTPEKFEAILKRQTPDSDKRAGADFVIDSSQGIDHAREQVKTVVRALRERATRQEQS